MKKVLGFIVLAFSLVLTACSTADVPQAATLDATLENGVLYNEVNENELDTQTYRRSNRGTYEVTIENLSSGQPFTPPVAVTHRRGLRLFLTGRRTTEGVRQIAENGNVNPLAEGLANSRRAFDSLVALPGPDGGPPPILPGASRTFEIDARTRRSAISFVSMLICTNDGFTGRTVNLPRRVGQSVTENAVGYDAGTEINTQAYEDIVPPCSLITRGKDNGGTDQSNPALAEGSGITVLHTDNIIPGVGDLTVDPHGWDEPVATITIKRIR